MNAATDGAVICNGLITYNAIPCPLPDSWRSELVAARGIVAINAVEARMRETIGVTVTRGIYLIDRCDERGE